MKLKIVSAKHYAKLGLYNLSIFAFGYSLVQVAYNSYKYTQHLKGIDFHLSAAASVLIGALGVYVLGKWIVNKELEVK